MTPKGADLEATDLIEVSTIESGSYVTRSITGQELIDAIPLPPTGLTVGTTPIASGTIGRVLFQGTGNVLQQSSSLFWDGTNNRLGIGTSIPISPIHILSPIGQQSTITLRTLDNTTSGGYTGINCFDNLDNLAFSFAYGNSGSLLPNSAIIGTRTATGVMSFVTGPSATVRATLFSTGNFAINTTTDAGFRLDVNGTARARASSGSYVNVLTVENTGSASVDFKNVATFIGNRGNASNIDDNTCIGLQQKSNIANNYGVFNFFNAGGNLSAFFGAQFVSHGTAQNGNLVFGTATSGSPSTKMTLFSTGNVGINTTTDAGYKLDVNGTARVSGQLTVAQAQGVQFTSGFSGLSGNCIYSQGSATLLFINRNQITANFYNGGSDTSQCIQFGVGIGSAQPANSACALFDLVSTTKGFLPPRLTTAQKNAIVSPVAGLQVFDTTLNQISYYNGTTWTNI
jgi:hypothetical protein